jgi:peptidoglycan/LPS O-acetylase OafA/YrhL
MSAWRSFSSITPLGTAFDPNANSLAFMRLGFAALVLLSHAFPLGGFNGGADWMWSWTKGQEDFGGFAVAGFFVVSGFLVTRSFVSSSTSVSYLWKRVLRIFPGFWVCLLVTVILFGPLAYFHQYGHLSGYINGPFLDTPEKYLQNNYLLSMNQYSVDSLLGSNPYPHAFDGSLWTLVNEFKCYLAVLALGIVGILRRARFVTLGIVASLWAIEIVQFRNPSWVSPKVPFFGDLQLIHLAFMFSLGAALFLFRDRIPLSNLFALVAVGIYAVGCRYGLYPGISEVAFAYLCLWVAVRLPIRNIDKYGDFSYGLYVYAFPVEQIASMHRVNTLGLVPYVILTFLASMVFAVLSWHLVEKQFLRLKRLRMPGFMSPPAWWTAKVRGPQSIPRTSGESVSNQSE